MKPVLDVMCEREGGGRLTGGGVSDQVQDGSRGFVDVKAQRVLSLRQLNQKMRISVH